MARRMGTALIPNERQRLHQVVFDDPNHTISAVKALRAAGFDVADVFTPFAVHGLDEAMGLKETRLPWATFFGGATGCTIAILLQAWTHTRDWPLNIGGKTNLAGPGMLPVIFELTVLLAAFGTVGALLFSGKLFPSHRMGTPKTQPSPKVTDDRFIILVREQDASFTMDALRKVSRPHHPVEIVEGWKVQ